MGNKHFMSSPFVSRSIDISTPHIPGTALHLERSYCAAGEEALYLSSVYGLFAIMKPGTSNFRLLLFHHQSRDGLCMCEETTSEQRQPHTTTTTYRTRTISRGNGTVFPSLQITGLTAILYAPANIPPELLKLLFPGNRATIQRWLVYKNTLDNT